MEEYCSRLLKSWVLKWKIFSHQCRLWYIMSAWSLKSSACFFYMVTVCENIVVFYLHFYVWTAVARLHYAYTIFFCVFLLFFNSRVVSSTPIPVLAAVNSHHWAWGGCKQQCAASKTQLYWKGETHRISYFLHQKPPSARQIIPQLLPTHCHLY